MNHVVVNADDLGLSREINEGISAGFEKGIVSDTSLLIEAPHADDALKRLERAGIRHAGIHINLDAEVGWDIPAGERHSRSELVDLLADRDFLDKCRVRARAQIERFLDSSLIPTHLDTHHHVHGFFPIFLLLVELMQEYRIPAMRFSPEGYGLKTRKPIPFHGSVYADMEEILRREGIFFCRTMVEGVERLAEIVSFPAELVAHPSAGGDEWRVHEMEVLASSGFRKALDDRGIRLVGYREFV